MFSPVGLPCLFYIFQCVSAHLKLLIHPFPASPLVTITIICVWQSVSLLLLVHLNLILDSTWKLPFSLWLSLLSKSFSKSIHVAANGLFHSFSCLSKIALCTYPIPKAVNPTNPKLLTYWEKKKKTVVSVVFLLTQGWFAVLMEDNCLWKRIRKGKNDDWHAYISKDYLKTAFIKDVSANRKFELNVQVICFHLRHLLSSGALPFSMTLSIFSVGIPLSWFSSWYFWSSSPVKRSNLPAFHSRQGRIGVH